MDTLQNLYNADPDQSYLKKTPDYMMSLAGPFSDDTMPWTGLLFGVPILGFYFWANNQFMVQRVLSARDVNHGRWGALFAGLLKLPVLLIMVIPGILAIQLYHEVDISGLNYMAKDGLGAQFLCTNLKDCPNLTYPMLLFNLLPTGLLGLVVAGFLAAMSSSISATLNSASTLITMDFVNNIWKGLSSKQLVRIGQVVTFILVLLAVAWAPMIERFDNIFEYLQLVLTFIAPPVVSVFLLGLFWPRGNGHGAFFALMTGFGLTILLILSQVFEWGGIFETINNIHFLHLAPLLLVICMITGILVSLATAAPAPEKLEGYVWKRELFKAESAELKDLPWYQNYRILAIILLAITAAVVIPYLV